MFLNSVDMQADQKLCSVCV